jgi:hypothetical protein
MSETYRVVVIELDDLLPRLESGLPNLCVVVTCREPADRFAALRTPDARPLWAAGHVRRLRTDLSIRRTYGTHRRAERARDRLVERLLREGYVVNRRRDQRRVYVIELDGGHLRDVGAGHVYVGETSRSPEERFAQHRAGGRLAARGTGRRALRLRPDLAPGGFHLGKDEAEAAEAATRQRLEALGYVVRGAHTAPTRTLER